MKTQLWAQFIDILVSTNTGVSPTYGTSECQMILGCHSYNFNNIIVPMGYPLPSVHCLLIGDQGQVISPLDNINEIGQIHAAGQIFI